MRKRWARTCATALSAVALVAAGCTGSKSSGAGSAPRTTATSVPSHPSQQESPSPVVPTSPTTTVGVLAPQPLAAWQACAGNAGPAGFDCATVPVPLDYTNPAGRKIGIAMARHKADGVKIGSLLFDPGGPGASGVDDLEGFALGLFSTSLLDHFDIVAFDPRGVARSAPIRCLSPQQLDQFVHIDPGPTTAAGFQALVNASRTFAQGCQALSGTLLPFVGTASAARDMDQIRQALGEAKLTYIGFSYGTLLGATYAEEYPTHIRAMVLDGAVDPSLDAPNNNIVQAAGFDKELAAFFAWCAADPACNWRPSGSLPAAYDALVARIRANPIPGGGGHIVGAGEAFYGVIWNLYDPTLWPALGNALQQAGRNDGSGLLAGAYSYLQRNPDGTYSNSLEANNAIFCMDAPWPTDPDAVRSLAAKAKQQAPEFGIPDLYGGLTCSAWPVKPSSQPHPIKAPGSPAIVVVGSTGDPATPYADAKALAGQLEHGVLITRVGDGHTGYRSSECVRTAVDAYLTTGKPPAPGISCPSP